VVGQARCVGVDQTDECHLLVNAAQLIGHFHGQHTAE